MQEKIRKDLLEMADIEYKEFQSKLCPKTNNILGVRVPKLRKYAKKLVKQDFRSYLSTAKNEYYEEIMLQGMVIGIANMEPYERLNYIKEFIPKIDNWAICDVFCSELKFVNENHEMMWQFLQKYKTSKNEFEVRFMVVIMLNYYISKEYLRRCH